MHTSLARMIFLWGMPGSGKSTFGRAYAHHAGLAFTDLDDYIASETGRTPADWIRSHGEAYFRSVEATSLRGAWKARQEGVLACGGGTPCFAGNATWMKRRGITVFLDVPAALLHTRLRSEYTIDRPLLEEGPGLLTQLEALLRVRHTFYRRAHLHLPSDAMETMIARLDLLMHTPL
jgi:shikimate kinase